MCVCVCVCDCSNDPQSPSQSTILKDKDENTEEIPETFETMQVHINGFQVNVDLLSSDDLSFLFILLYSVLIVCLLVYTLAYVNGRIYLYK